MQAGQTNKLQTEMQPLISSTHRTETGASAVRRVTREDTPNCFLQRCRAIKTCFLTLLERLITFITCGAVRPKLHGNYKPIIIVGFYRGTINNVIELLHANFVDLEIEPRYFNMDEDFNIDECIGKKVIFCAAFTERNNILGPGRDSGEMSEITENYEKHSSTAASGGLDATALIYAGTPKNQYPIPKDSMFPSVFTKMFRFQPKLERFINNRSFYVFNSDYRLNAVQRDQLHRFLQSD